MSMGIFEPCALTLAGILTTRVSNVFLFVGSSCQVACSIAKQAF